MKKLKDTLTDYWFGTITGSILIAMSLQSILSAVVTYYPQLFESVDLNSSSYSFPTDYLMTQVFAGVIGICSRI
jgi:hypothetical protein